MLTMKEIGRRIAALRKQKGLSQADLARCINISRSTLAQIELGNKNLDALELRNLGMELGFSLDAFMSDGFPKPDPMVMEPITAYSLQTERIAMPVFQLPKFRNVLLYLLGKCAGKPNVGETVLYKLLYFSDFNYYELYEEHLSGAVYRKLPFGPVPDNIVPILRGMTAEGLLQRLKTEYHGMPQTRYIPLVRSDLTMLKASEKEVLDKVMDQLSDWSGTAISRYSHQDLPWLATREGEIINFELAFYREPPYSVRNFEEQEDRG